ncbi:hypothetical protein HDZ31DRAFT_51724, partial [Schizophyllum fasciatum]
LAFVNELARRPETVVFGGVRNPAQATDLQALAGAHPGKVHIVKVVSADRAGNDAAIQEIKQVAGRLDVVIANAAISDSFEPALEVPPAQVVRHVEVNTNGPLVLFQAAYSLLRESPQPKFVTVTSVLASISVASQLPIDTYAYSASKVAVNWIMCKLHHDFPDFVIFPISPGCVETDMARLSRAAGEQFAEFQRIYTPIPPEESARQMLEQVDVATRETHGAQFVDYTGLGKWGW